MGSPGKSGTAAIGKFSDCINTFENTYCLAAASIGNKTGFDELPIPLGERTASKTVFNCAVTANLGFHERKDIRTLESLTKRVRYYYTKIKPDECPLPPPVDCIPDDMRDFIYCGSWRCTCGIVNDLLTPRCGCGKRQVRPRTNEMIAVIVQE